MRFQTAALSLLLIGIVCTNALAADPGDGIKPPGDCTTKQHEDLQKDVDRLCHGVKVKCTSQQDCDILYERWLKATRCADARDRINRKCFRGGEKEHRKKAAEARRSASQCLQYYREKCEDTQTRSITNPPLEGKKSPKKAPVERK